MVVLEEFTRAVCDYVIEQVSESIDDPESQDVLRKHISEAVIRNKKKLPSVEPVKSDALKFRNTIDTGRTTTVSAYNLHWGDWKEKNQQKEFPDPDDPKKKLSQHKYWQKHVWGKMDAKERKPWEDQAKQAREEIKKSGGAKTKRKVSKSGFQLFLEKMKTKMEPDEVFNHPDNNQEVKTHHYLLYIWSNHVKISEDLKKPFEETASQLKSGELDEYDLNDLPYLDPKKLRAYDFENLEMIEE